MNEASSGFVAIVELLQSSLLAIETIDLAISTSDFRIYGQSRTETAGTWVANRVKSGIKLVDIN